MSKNFLGEMTLVLASTLVLGACSTQTNVNLISANTPGIAALPPAVVDYSNAWINLDGEKVLATFAVDGVYIDPQVPKGLTGKAISAHVASFKDIAVKIKSYDFLADGRPRTFWEVYDAQGNLLAKGHDHFTLVDGKITRMEGFFD